MIEKNLSSIEKWLANFAKQPLEALDRLLMGRAYMGRLDRNDTDEILFRLFHTATKYHLTALDEAMRSWFVKYWETAPSSIPTSRWAEILRNAFSAAIRLDLHETQAWLLENHARARVWLRSLYLGPDRDPEADLLRTLALCQRNQGLLPLWMRFCGLEEDRPLHFASIGLLGLRKLPDENGEPHGDLHPAVFSGIADLANAIDKQVRLKKEGEAFWLLKVRALMARYPRSSQYWAEHFLPLVSSSPSSPAAKWLGKLIPTLSDMLEGRRLLSKSTQSPRPISWNENKAMFDLLANQSLEEIRMKLTAFLERHRNYALQTGYAELLVKTLSNIGYRIFRQAPALALALVEEAFSWAPFNSYVWVERARIESYLGRDKRAVELLWEAKRKFPENSTIRNNLAELLRKQGKDDIAEILYRQTIEDFPEDVFCRNGLAEVLKAQEKLPEAEAVYRQTMEDFPTAVVCRNGLAEVLKAQEKLPEAEAVYRQTMEDFPEDVFCRSGLAVIWLIQNKKEDGIRLLEQTVNQFPTDLYAKELLQRVRETPEDISDVVDDYEEFSKEMTQSEQPRLMDSMPNIAAEDTMDGIKVKEDEKESLSKKLETDDALPIPTSTTIPTNGNGLGETYIGLTNLYRLAARRAEGSEKEHYQQEFFAACEKALAESPNNIFALLEKGFWMLDEEPEKGKTYFAEQFKNGDQPHVLGFRMGYLQAKMLKSEAVTAKHWKELIDDFPGSKTLITLENARQELLHANETTLSVLEALRKQVRSDIESLPSTLRENEKWVRSNVEKRLFARIDLAHPLMEDALPLVMENHSRHNLVLRGIAEQSLTNI